MEEIGHKREAASVNQKTDKRKNSCSKSQLSSKELQSHGRQWQLTKAAAMRNTPKTSASNNTGESAGFEKLSERVYR